MLGEAIPVVEVHAGGEGRHLLVDARAEARGHREEGLLDLVDRHRLRAGVGDHRGGERGEALLARGVVRRADGGEKLHVELGQLRAQDDGLQRRGGPGGGRRRLAAGAAWAAGAGSAAFA
ncbi:MAG: hypothetical protein U0599_11840 [Vicinamibacteria bacterium]